MPANEVEVNVDLIPGKLFRKVLHYNNTNDILLYLLLLFKYNTHYIMCLFVCACTLYNLTLYSYKSGPRTDCPPISCRAETENQPFRLPLLTLLLLQQHTLQQLQSLLATLVLLQRNRLYLHHHSHHHPHINSIVLIQVIKNIP